MGTSFESKEYFDHDLELRHKFNNDPCFPDFHFHDSFEIYYSVSGGSQYLIEDNIYELNPGDLFIINNYEIHKPLRNNRENYERIILAINPEKIKEINPSQAPLLLSCFTSRKRGEHNKILLSDEERSQFFALVNKIKQLKQHELGYETLLELYFVEFLVYVNRWYRTSFSTMEPQSNHGLNPIIKSIIDYLNDNFTKEVSLDKLADEFHLSKYYMCQLFKTVTGTTIHRYVISRRLARSKILLHQGYSVTDTSEMAGFQNYTHFIRTFTSHFGVSPKQFNKSI
ncbi:MAG: helix-turn-helix domain-containing protein [Clostridia bacterium]|nr:helix-turn-helix domain-containing protein [Clostridia bacterium]